MELQISCTDIFKVDDKMKANIKWNISRFPQIRNIDNDRHIFCVFFCNIIIIFSIILCYVVLIYYILAAAIFTTLLKGEKGRLLNL